MNHTIAFERSYGVRHITVPTGDVVTAISQPDWPSFEQALGALATDPGRGNLIMTPELMTSADVTPDMGTTAITELVGGRIEAAREMTRQLPGSRLLLGSAMLEPDEPRPYNCVLFLEDGAEVGRTYKASPANMHEIKGFALKKVTRQPARTVANILCSDILHLPKVGPGVKTMLVSGCWGVGMQETLSKLPEELHMELLQEAAENIFTWRSQVDTIVMADRVPIGSHFTGPLNFVASRQK